MSPRRCVFQTAHRHAYRKGSQPCDEHDCGITIYADNPNFNRTLTRQAVLLICLFALLSIFVNFVAAQEITGDTKVTTHSSPGYLHVEISNDLITVQAREVTTKNLLDRIAHQSCLSVILYGPLEERLTMELHGLPLPEAMRRILHNESFILQSVQPSSCAKQSNDVSFNKLWVFSKAAETDHSRQLIVNNWVAPNADKRTAPWNEALTDSDDARMRLETVSELAIAGGSQAAAVLAIAALGDENVSVREEAIMPWVRSVTKPRFSSSHKP
ncbi:MAG: hypothetical protein GY807_14170 [Gammaproteobacteria bacterium]|nr:hypothetical protein [Gammaproteobacteria bacterium]